MFSANGTISVRRVQIGGVWQPVEQGRQWMEADGRHLLLMFADGNVREIVLRQDTLVWELLSYQSGQTIV